MLTTKTLQDYQLKSIKKSGSKILHNGTGPVFDLYFNKVAYGANVMLFNSPSFTKKSQYRYLVPKYIS